MPAAIASIVAVRDELAVDHGAEREPVVDEAAQQVHGVAADCGVGELLLQLEHPRLGQRGQPGAGRLDAAELREPAAERLGLGERDVGRRPGDAVDARDERLGARHAEQRQHRAAAGRLAGDRHPGRVAAERRDVVAHPLQGEQPVEHATVHRRIRDPAEAVEAEAVRDRDRDDAVAVERGAVVPGAGGRAGEVAAAVDVDEHRQRGIRRRSRREDVHVQRRLAGNRRLGDERHAGVAALRGRRRTRWRRARPPTGRAARVRRSGARRRAARRRGCRGRRPRRCPRHPLATDRGRGRRWCRPRRGSRFR